MAFKSTLYFHIFIFLFPSLFFAPYDFRTCEIKHQFSSGFGGANGPWPPGRVKISHKKMATEGGRIDFMFLGPSPVHPTAGSTTAVAISGWHVKSRLQPSLGLLKHGHAGFNVRGRLAH